MAMQVFHGLAGKLSLTITNGIRSLHRRVLCLAGSNNISTEVREAMKAKLNQMDFDFSQFTMERFVAYVEQERGRKILFIPYSMPVGMFGVWMSDADEPYEYVFYDRTAPPIHQIHIQLHELSHILNNHKTNSKDRANLEQILEKKDADFSPAYLKMEQEAETLAALIQEQALRYVRVQQLKAIVSSSEALTTHLKVLELV